jgi:hypothetical protein
MSGDRGPDPKIQNWVDRVYGIRERDEHTLYVTEAEWHEIRQYGALPPSDESPELIRARREAALARGERDRFLGLLVIVDDAEAERQRRRLATKRVL